MILYPAKNIKTMSYNIFTETSSHLLIINHYLKSLNHLPIKHLILQVGDGGGLAKINQFADWLDSLPYPIKIVIAGTCF